MSTGRHAIAAKTSILCDCDIGRRVADDDGSLGRNFNLVKHMLSECQLRLVPLCVGAANTNGNVFRKARVATNFARGLTMFVREEHLRDTGFVGSLD